MELQISTVLVPAQIGTTSPSVVDRFAIEQSPQMSPTAGEIGQVVGRTGGRAGVVA